MAPEVENVSDENGYSAYYADIFSLGCVIYFLCTGKEEWNGYTLRKVSEDDNLQ